MSQIGTNSGPNDILNSPVVPPQLQAKPIETAPNQPTLSTEELEAASQFYNEVRERQAKNSNPKWLSTQDIIKLIGD